MLQVVIIAGGLATRLWPETKSVPKSLIEINGKPFIDWQLKLLKEQGVDKVLLCIGYLGDQIKDYVGNGEKWGLKVDYSSEGENLLGTGGALRNALDKLDDFFFLTYGDSYLPINYSNVSDSFFNLRKPALMTIYKNNSNYDKSNIVMKNNVIKKYEKGSEDPELIYIDYGLLVMSKSIISKFEGGKKIDLADPLKELVKKEELSSFEVYQRFYEVGSRTGIEMLENYLKKECLK